MSDTIDRLVRMLDDERTALRRANERASFEGQRYRDALAHGRRAERERDYAEKTIDEWREYAGHLLSLIPQKTIDKSVKTPPKDYAREVPF